MAKIRFSALEELAHRKPLRVPKRRRVSEIFGCDVLTIEKMRGLFVYRSFQEIGKGDDRRWDDRQGTGRSGG